MLGLTVVDDETRAVGNQHTQIGIFQKRRNLASAFLSKFVGEKGGNTVAERQQIIFCGKLVQPSREIRRKNIQRCNQESGRYRERQRQLAGRGKKEFPHSAIPCSNTRYPIWSGYAPARQGCPQAFRGDGEYGHRPCGYRPDNHNPRPYSAEIRG